MITTTIPRDLRTAYVDAVSHSDKLHPLPSNPDDFRLEEHFQALDRACHNDISRLVQTLVGVDPENDEDPNATAFLRHSWAEAQRLRLWNIEAFNGEVQS